MAELMVPIIELPWSEPAIPRYRSVREGDWKLAPTPAIKHPIAGYFTVVRELPPGWVITQRGKRIWMSLTRMEIESHMPHFEAAHGHVVIAGLGLGFALFNIMQKPEVEHVTVLERNPSIVALLDRAAAWRNWPRHKEVELVMGDALEFKTSERVDFLYADIWPKMFDDDALQQTKIMQDNIHAHEVGFWTQEADYVQYCRGRRPGLMSYQKFAAESGLPLIAQSNPRYPYLAFAALTLQLAAQCKPGSREREQLFWQHAHYVQHRGADLIDAACRVTLDPKVFAIAGEI